MSATSSPLGTPQETDEGDAIHQTSQHCTTNGGRKGQESNTPENNLFHAHTADGRVPTVMENPGKSWKKKLSWKVMETEENK